MDRIKKFVRMFVFDLRYSLSRNKYVYILMFILLVTTCMNYSNKAVRYGTETGTVEYLLNFERGLEKIVVVNDKANFDTPIMYLGFALFFSLLTGNNLFGDVCYSMLVQGKSKKMWILCKNLTTALNVVFVYVCAWIVALIFGGGGRIINARRALALMKIDYINIDTSKNLTLFVVMFVAPVMASFAITQLQSVISLLAGNVAGFTATIALYAISLFDVNMFLLGNGCMVQRYSYFMEEGLNVAAIIVIYALIALIAGILQLIIFEKRDWIR